jgi:exopolysaccharide biosynthesis WecB/TagA/CpsF family protein
MTGVLNRKHGQRLNSFHMLAPDGQPVRWALNWLGGGERLRDRVYGPELTKRVCAAAAQHGIGVFLYGSRDEVVNGLADQLSRWSPDLHIAGLQPSRFREATSAEDQADVDTINRSGAGVVLVGLGCPLQERWAFEHLGRIQAVMLCVGAAFDFHAGYVPQAPPWMQRSGLEWLFRLWQEPRRLWRRYLLLNPLYLILLFLQVGRIWKPEVVR